MNAIDARSIKKLTLPLCLIALVALAGVGCDDTGSDTAPTAEQASATAPGESTEPSEQAPASSSAPSRNAEHYRLRSPQAAVPVGQKQKVEVAIEPASGLKINHEFPWSLEFAEADGIQLAQKSFSKEQLDLADKRASAALLLEADQAGEHELEATGNFSVCNDTKCYVIRDEPLRFSLKANSPEGQTPPEQAGQ